MGHRDDVLMDESTERECSAGVYRGKVIILTPKGADLSK